MGFYFVFLKHNSRLADLLDFAGYPEENPSECKHRVHPLSTSIYFRKTMTIFYNSVAIFEHFTEEGGKVPHSPKLYISAV